MNPVMDTVFSSDLKGLKSWLLRRKVRVGNTKERKDRRDLLRIAECRVARRGCLEDEVEKNFFFEWATNIVSTSIR